MGFKLKTKTKATTEAEDQGEIQIPAQTKAETAEQVVDAIGKLAAREEELNTQLMADPRMVEMLETQREKKRLETELLTSVEAHLDQEHIFQGAKFVARISAGAVLRKITDKEALVEILEQVQDGLAVNLADFKIGDLDKYLTPEQQAQVLTGNVTKRRSLKVEPI